MTSGESEAANARVPLAHYRSAAVAVLIGTAVSIAAYLFVVHLNFELSKANFMSLARNELATIQSGLRGYEDAGRAMAMYFETVDAAITPSQFRAASEALRKRHPGIQ